MAVRRFALVLSTVIATGVSGVVGSQSLLPQAEASPGAAAVAATRTTPSLVYVDSSNNVWATSADGLIKRQLTTDGVSFDKYFSPSMQDDGTVVFVNQLRTTYVLNADGTTKSGPWHAAPPLVSYTSINWAEAQPSGRFYLTGELLFDLYLDNMLTVNVSTVDSPSFDACAVSMCPINVWRPRFLPGTNNYTALDTPDPLGPSSVVDVVTPDGQKTSWIQFNSGPATATFDNVDVSRTGNRILAETQQSSSAPSDLTLLQGAGPPPAAVTPVCGLDGFGAGDARPRFSPDGTQISFSEPDGVHVADSPTVAADGTTCVLANDHLLIPGGKDADWSPYTLTIPPNHPVPPVPPGPPVGLATGTLTAPRSFTGGATVAYSSAVGPSTLTVTPRSGGRPVSVVTKCHNGAAVVSCSTGPMTAVSLSPPTWWLPGETYRVTAPATSTAAALDASFGAPLHVSATAPPLTYAWATTQARAAYGGSVLSARSPGSSFSYAFTGPSVTWYSTTGPDHGLADVYVDGRRRSTVNEYSAGDGAKVPHALTKLGPGRHVLTVKVLGRKGSARAKGTLISFDAVRVGRGKVVATPAGTATWGARSQRADLPGESVSLAFVGTGIRWTPGKADHLTVYVDGAKRKPKTHTVVGLRSGRHVLRLVLSKGSATVTGFTVS